ncbi:N-acyl-L-homoserine lactone synthetase [Roseovarius litoreus]|uniref:Acyl-homoserine-lactone synthase n=1 Tax=Roseovarius litoreus TaxID=1155722 RepID=A0A1M7E542_9RHOB|nr:acyl-homoserine-lactone synthase [Roseovarius litoreus]SHL86827.1 N-acyl-L-homoserine lactone synthetase [Roseovarius litoreus]
MKTFKVPPETSPAASVFPELSPDGAPSRSLTSSRDKKRLRIRAERNQSTGIANVRASSLSFANMHNYGELLVNYLRARKHVFIDQLDWDIYQTDGMEFDQYDTPQCRWIVVHEFGEILAGIRLLPTTARCGIYSYMLRDAQRGILDNLPTDVLFMQAPVDPKVWEAARVFITETVPAQRRFDIQQVLVSKLISTARAEGASHVIGIVPAIWARWLRRLDLRAVPIGPRFHIDGTYSQAILFNAVNAMN